VHSNERVILIKGDASKWYNQAIFIVKKEIPPDKIPVDFVAEAEKIINKYMTGQSRKPAPAVKPQAPAAKVKKSRFDFMLNMVMLAGCLVIVGMLAFGFLQ
jgi:hypothetical protein